MKPLTPEHKARMAEGRRKAAAERRMSRGRPALREEVAPLPREMTAPHASGDPNVDELERAIAAMGDGEQVTRQSRGATDSTFDIPLQGRRAGWDYEWKTVRVNGEEVDPSSIVEIQQGGWRLVPKTHFPSLVPPGWQRAYIERWGQQLYMRPQRLTDEANDELLKHALKVREDKLRQAQVDGGAGTAPRINWGGVETGRDNPGPMKPGRQGLL